MRRPLLILGATSPIGAGVVEAAVEAGRPVIAIACDDAGLQRLVAAHPGAHLQVLSAPFRTDEEAAALARTLHRLDRPFDGIVAAVCGGRERGRLLDQPASRPRETFHEVLIPHLAAARHLLPPPPASGRSGGYVLIDGPGGEHPWAGYGHRSVGAAALRMLARVLHDEARVLPVRVQMLSVDLPVRTDANAAHACAQWPSTLSIGRRALAMIDRRDSEGAAPLVHCAKSCEDDGGLTLALGQAAASATLPDSPPRSPRTRSEAASAPKPDSDDTLLTSRCLQDVRTLLDSVKSTVPTKGDSPR